MNKSIAFLKQISDVAGMEIPERVIARAKQSFLDYVAVAFAGSHFQKDKIQKYINFSEPEEGNYTVIGTGKKLALKETIFLNGLNGHALDFDDGTNAGIIHLGSPIFSLLLPLAQQHKISFDKLLRSAIIGYEVSYTMAISIQPGHKAMGYHATGTCGTLGSVIAASYMLDFTEEERFEAFAAACVAASGMLKVLDDGSELKPYNVAKTALLASTAIQMAKAGFKGHPDPLGGRGFFKMMTGKEDIEIKPMLLNGTYAIEKTYTKPYASCRYTHPSIEAAVTLRNSYNIHAEDISEINIRTYSLAVSGHDHTDIPGSYSAKMSTPYSVAAGLIYGKAGLQEFTETATKDGKTLQLTKKVSVVSDDALSEIFPEVQAAIVSIKTNDGRCLEERVDFPKGEPENPLSIEEFKCRYADLMEYAGVESDRYEKIYSLVSDGICQVSDIMALC